LLNRFDGAGTPCETAVITGEKMNSNPAKMPDVKKV
jgi:hypothetical protein